MFLHPLIASSSIINLSFLLLYRVSLVFYCIMCLIFQLLIFIMYIYNMFFNKRSENFLHVEVTLNRFHNIT